METELYKMLNTLLIESGMSKRTFAESNNISRPWFIEFINPYKDFRPLQTRTMNLLKTSLDIPIEVMMAYNDWVYKERSK